MSKQAVIRPAVPRLVDAKRVIVILVALALTATLVLCVLVAVRLGHPDVATHFDAGGATWTKN